MTTTAAPTTFAAAERRLAERLPGYQPRPAQRQLAAAVERVVVRPGSPKAAAPRHLLGQAGCGTGKTLSYLIPAILSGARVIVSAGVTKSLQDQISNKDLPFLRENLGVPFDACVLKGRSNYLCEAKLNDADPSEVPSAARVREAAARSDFDGTREDLGFEVADSEWTVIRSDFEDCTDCRHATMSGGPVCYAELARARAQRCQVVVVNHHLLCTDLVVRSKGVGGMLGDYDYVVLDEAHELEEVAAEQLGDKLTSGSFRSTLNELRNWVQRYVDEDDQRHVEILRDHAPAVLTAAESMFLALPEGKIRSATLVDHGEVIAALTSALVKLRAAWDKLPTGGIPAGDYDRAKKRRFRVWRRLNNLVDAVSSIVIAEWTEKVRWVEQEPFRGQQRKVVRIAPVRVDGFLRAELFSRVPCVLVSATLAADGKFDFVAGRFGVDSYDGLNVGTPFDFPRQTRRYVPRRMAPPTREGLALWRSQSATEILSLIRASRGRALVLFTSRADMGAVLRQIRSRIPYQVLVQGEGDNAELARRFKEDTTSVLFGLKSFMTGFDVPGEACSLVIISKLPFPQQDHPLVEARCEAIEARGGNAFFEYSVPVMSLAVQQAAGRLCRTVTDQGVIAILDSRIHSKGYGRAVLRDLPPSTPVGSVGEVQDYFDSIAG